MSGFPIAVMLLDEELLRLERTHLAYGAETGCDGCRRAHEVRLELDALCDMTRPASRPAVDDLAGPGGLRSRDARRQPGVPTAPAGDHGTVPPAVARGRRPTTASPSAGTPTRTG